MLSALTDANDIELKASFQKLAFNLICDTVETNVTLGYHGALLGRHNGGRHDEMDRLSAHKNR